MYSSPGEGDQSRRRLSGSGGLCDARGVSAKRSDRRILARFTPRVTHTPSPAELLTQFCRPLRGAAGTPLPERGRLLFSGVNVDARTGDVILRILVDNPERQLLPGMYVRARVPRGAPASALLLPQQAVLRSAGGQAYAWVIAADGKAMIRTLEVDGSVNRQWLVRHGLKAGEKVVVEGQERLQEGVLVDPRDWQVPVASASAPPTSERQG